MVEVEDAVAEDGEDGRCNREFFFEAVILADGAPFPFVAEDVADGADDFLPDVAGTSASVVVEGEFVHEIG